MSSPRIYIWENCSYPERCGPFIELPYQEPLKGTLDIILTPVADLCYRCCINRTVTLR
jgi:hypothetical protein